MKNIELRHGYHVEGPDHDGELEIELFDGTLLWVSKYDLESMLRLFDEGLGETP